MAIRHRNNSLFYRSQRGARVGDIYMTLIHTTELQGENPFHYLTELMRHESAVAEDPAAWLPWNYRDTLARCLRDASPTGGERPVRQQRRLRRLPTPVPDRGLRRTRSALTGYCGAADASRPL